MAIKIDWCDGEKEEEGRIREGGALLLCNRLECHQETIKACHDSMSNVIVQRVIIL